MEKYESLEQFAQEVQHNGKIIKAAKILEIEGTFKEKRADVAAILGGANYASVDDFLRDADNFTLGEIMPDFIK